jgi:hypothetical protein
MDVRRVPHRCETFMVITLDRFVDSTFEACETRIDRLLSRSVVPHKPPLAPNLTNTLPTTFHQQTSRPQPYTSLQQRRALPTTSAINLTPIYTRAELHIASALLPRNSAPSPHTRAPSRNYDACTTTQPNPTFCTCNSVQNRPNGGHHRARSNEHVSIPPILFAPRPRSQPHHRPLQKAVCPPSPTHRRRAPLHARQIRHKRRRLDYLQEIPLLLPPREFKPGRTLPRTGSHINHQGTGARA